MRKVYLSKKVSFEAAHHLPNYEGKCNRLHGHSYKLEVVISGNVLSDTACEDISDSMVLDFTTMKRVIQEQVIDLFDHTDLNRFFLHPTAEIMCMEIFEKLQEPFKKHGANLEVVKLWETEDSYAEYRGE